MVTLTKSATEKVHLPIHAIKIKKNIVLSPSVKNPQKETKTKADPPEQLFKNVRTLVCCFLSFSFVRRRKTTPVEGNSELFRRS